MIPFRSAFTLANPAVVTATDDTDAAAYFTAMTTAPSAAERARVNTLVRGLKTDGIWDYIDWLPLLAAETSQAALLNLRKPTKTLTPQNFPTFTANRGFTGDGSGAYLDFGEAFNAAGNLFTASNSLLAGYINQVGAYAPILGSSQSTRTFIYGRSGTTINTFSRLNSSLGMVMDPQIDTTGLGFKAAVIDNSTTEARLYQSLEPTQVVSGSVGTVVATGPAYVFRNGSVYAAHRVPFVVTGACPPSPDVAIPKLRARLLAYLNDKGAA